MFEVVGTMQSYLQQFQLKKSAKQKVTTGQSFDWKETAKSSFVKAQEKARTAPKSIVELSLEKAEKEDERTAQIRKDSIRQKLRRGKKLSERDMNYLRKHDAELYKKAKVTMEEREKLERALKSAKTKSEAMRAVAVAAANAAAAYGDFGKSGGGAPGAAAAGGAVSQGGSSDAASFSAAAAAGGEIGAAELNAGGEMAAEVSTEMTGKAFSAAAEGVSAGTETAAAAPANAENADNANNAMIAEDADKTGAAFTNLEKAKESGEFDDPLILLIMRHLQAEWQDFRKSDQYKDMPEDEMQAARRRDAERHRPSEPEPVKAVSLTAAAAAYQMAETETALSRVLGAVGTSS